VDESVFSVEVVILPSFSILIYDLEDKQYARLWPQFRDVVSSHPHDHHQLGSFR
jgi:hypothetical protein